MKKIFLFKEYLSKRETVIRLSEYDGFYLKVDGISGRSYWHIKDFFKEFTLLK